MNTREIVIDGYNLLHKLFPEIRRQPLERCRQKTEAMLQSYLRKGRCMITIVYDGGNVRESSSCTSICTVYTAAGVSADAWIIDYVKSLNTSRKMVTIVSSDREVCRYCKAYGARCLDSEAFIATLDIKKSQSGGLHQSAGRKFSDGFLENSEVEEWMRLFEKGRP